MVDRTRDLALPPNSTQFEIDVADGFRYNRQYGPVVDYLLRYKWDMTELGNLHTLENSFPEHVWRELGLSYIAKFFTDPITLIDEGTTWQRKKGTPIAFTLSLKWVNYLNTTLEEFPLRRRMWTRFYLNMGELPGVEIPRLPDAEYLVRLSSPARSDFWRGYFVYDGRPVEYAYTNYADHIWGDDSGVRLLDGKTKWSHGEDHPIIEATLSESDRVKLRLVPDGLHEPNIEIGFVGMVHPDATEATPVIEGYAGDAAQFTPSYITGTD